MTTFQFATKCENNAKTFLSSPKYDYLTKGQKELVLANLGKCRVLDPNFHAPAISFECPELMVEFVKKETITDPNMFMFRHSYWPNLPLLKFGLEQGFALHDLTVSSLVQKTAKDSLNYLLEQKLITEEAVLHALCSYPNFELIKYYHEKLKFSQLPYIHNIADTFDQSQIMELITLKLMSHKGLQYSKPDMYNAIVRLKKQLKAKKA